MSTDYNAISTGAGYDGMGYGGYGPGSGWYGMFGGDPSSGGFSGSPGPPTMSAGGGGRAMLPDPILGNRAGFGPYGGPRMAGGQGFGGQGGFKPFLSQLLGLTPPGNAQGQMHGGADRDTRDRDMVRGRLAGGNPPGRIGGGPRPLPMPGRPTNPIGRTMGGGPGGGGPRPAQGRIG